MLSFRDLMISRYSHLSPLRWRMSLTTLSFSVASCNCRALLSSREWTISLSFGIASQLKVRSSSYISKISVNARTYGRRLLSTNIYSKWEVTVDAWYSLKPSNLCNSSISALMVLWDEASLGISLIVAEPFKILLNLSITSDNTCFNQEVPRVAGPFFLSSISK